MSRRLLIGTDEAGYGPNLGPLTVTATAWEIPADVEPASLWEEFNDIVTNAPTRGDQRLFVADSKAVYSSGDGLEDLEVAVLAFLRTLNCPVSTIDELCQGISGDDFMMLYQEEAWNQTPGRICPVMPVKITFSNGSRRWMMHDSEADSSAGDSQSNHVSERV
jgi:hypothetical protein